LLELLVVVALIAIATAGVSLSLRDSADSALERDATRLAALLETARAQARASGLPVVWRHTPAPGLPQRWLHARTHTTAPQAVVLGPEPLIPAQSIALSSTTGTSPTWWVVSDGLRPFQAQRTPEWTAR